MKHVSKFLSRKELADLYGVSRKTLYNQFKRKGIKLGRGLLSPKDLVFIYDKLGEPKKILHQDRQRKV